ncbi:MAG: PfkB family carbohydrate kinase [Pseudomonadota bacterium]
MTRSFETGAVLCVGRLYADLIFTGLPEAPSPGHEVYADALDIRAGGGAFITGAHLALLGYPVQLSAFVSPPPFQGILMSEIRDAGLDARLCQAGSGAQVTVVVASEADRSFLTKRADRACPVLDPAELAALGIRHIHIGELASLADCPEILALARGIGATVSLDCGWDAALSPVELAPLIEAVDVFLPNAAEHRWLAEAGCNGALAPLVVVKQGRDGATALRGGQTVFSAARVVDAVDPTGAGDAFNAGFLAAWLRGDDLESSLRAGNRQGALAVQATGGLGIARAEAPAREDAAVPAN